MVPAAKKTLRNGQNSAFPQKKLLIMLLSVSALLLVVLVAVTLVKANSNAILSGVSVGGVDLSGLSRASAEAVLSEKAATAESQTLTIRADGDTFRASVADLGIAYDAPKSAEQAFSYGHGSFFKAFVPVMKSLFGGKKSFGFALSVSDVIFDRFMTENTDYDESVTASFEILDDAVRVTNGQTAYTVNPVSAKALLTDHLAALDFSDVTLTKETIAPIPFDVDAFAEQYAAEPTKATYYRDEDGGIGVTRGNDKVILNKQNAKSLVNAHAAPGETYDIPATVKKVGHTTDELLEALFRDVMSSYSTSFASSSANRASNVSLAAQSINGKILLPGESFSYNEALGRRTPEAGYKLAGAYVGGESVEEYGGGICQISSTLYNAVMLANLRVTSRTCHMFKVAYVPLGRDATVNYGTVDFTFLNDTDYPIKIHAYTTAGRQAICEIIGTKTENFSVSFETTNVSSVPFSVKTEEDPTLEEGQEKIKTGGSNGARCSVYRIVSVDGVEVSRTKESDSYYMPHNAVKLVGTKAAAADSLFIKEAEENSFAPSSHVSPSAGISSSDLPDGTDAPSVPSILSVTEESNATVDEF